MTDTQNLLGLVYKNASMGVQTLPEMITKADGEFRNALQNRLDKYRHIQSRAKDQLAQSGMEDNSKVGLNGFEKASTDVMLKFQMMRDPSTPHMADMLIRGSAMGIRDVCEQMSNYPGADRQAVSLANELKKLEEDGMEELKKYLSVT